MGVLGLLLGVGLLIALALRGVNVIVASLLCAAVVAITNGQALGEALAVHYSTAAFNFARDFFLLFVAGAAFGRVMGESHAAASIAYALSHALGPHRTLIIGVIACAMLTYGGVNVFIVIFTVYPIGLALMQRSNTPKRLFMAATSLGAGTFTMTALPGSPSIHNVIMSTALGTPLTAAPAIGLTASAVMIVLGLVYLERERKKAIAAGEGFVPGPADIIPDEPDPKTMPDWRVALLPLVLVLATIIVPLIVKALAPQETGVFAYAASNPLVWTVVALLLGTAAGFILFYKRVPHVFGVLGRGAENAILPLINTAVIIGFGGVVTKTAAFGSFAGLMVGSNLPPILSASIAVNIISGIVGSSSGGLRIFAESLAKPYLEAGVDPEVLHRVIAIGAGGLDSLPHCGAIVTTLTIMQLTHKQAYKDTGVVTVLIPLVALVVAVAMAIVLF